METFVVGEMYLVDEDFAAEQEGELAVNKGQMVTVEEPEDPRNPGWIFVSIGDQAGYVPTDFLVAGSASAAPVPPAIPAAPPGPFNSLQGPDPYQPSEPIQSYEYDPNFASNARVPVEESQAASYGVNPFETTGSFRAPVAVFGNSNSVDHWLPRDNAIGSVSYPEVPQRLWFYRDIFNDTQGPFNPEEMRARLEARHITETTKVIVQTGVGSLHSLEEQVVKDVYPQKDLAFRTPPVIRSKSLWYFVDSMQQERGPFTNEQMKFWLNDGFFSGDTLVRTADGKMKLTPLKSVFDDPLLAFVSTRDDSSLESARTHPPVLSRADSGGKGLLLDALEGTYSKADRGAGQLAVPKAIQGNEQTDGEKEDKFDKVGIGSLEDADASEEAKKEKSNGSGGTKASNTKSPVYGGGYGEYKGIPSLGTVKPSSYAALLYTWVTRPLHPDANTVQFYIKRDIDGSHINFNKYVLYLEQSNTPILAAFRHHHTITSYYDIKMVGTGKIEDITSKALTIANLEVNFSGTSFLLHNSVTGHQGEPKDMATVIYERNRVSNKGPRRMRVAIPRVEDDKPEFLKWKHGGKQNARITEALKSLQVRDIIPLLNKPPKWNPKRRSYMLDFKGRVTRSSVKNFQLVDAIRDPDHLNIIMQHGRIGAHKFTCDIKHPLSVLQGFAIALSSLHSKKLVD